jgi:hypothetical protein
MVVAGSLLGCQLPLNNAACPCAQGWVCCPSNNVCVSDTTAQCPGSPDGDHPDAPGSDADDAGGGGALAQRLELVHGWANDRFGFAVALAGDLAAVGVPGRDDAASSAGAVVVFERRGGAGGIWVQVAVLAAPDPLDNLLFGQALAFVGQDALLIGAPGIPGGPTGSGHAYLFRRTADGWSWQQTIEPDLTGLSADQAIRLTFALRLAADGERAIVYGGGGVAHVYQLNSAGLVHLARLQPPEAVGELAIHGATAVISTSNGGTYAFEEAAGWTATLLAEAPGVSGRGHLAFDGQRLAISRGSSSVRIFAHTASGWSEPDDVALPGSPQPATSVDLDLAWAGSDLIMTIRTLSSEVGLERIRSIGGGWQPDPILVIDAAFTNFNPLAVSGDRLLVGRASSGGNTGHATLYRIDGAGITEDQALALDDGPLSIDGAFAAGGGHLLASTSRGTSTSSPSDRSHGKQQIWFERDRDGLYRRRPSLVTDSIRRLGLPIAVAGSHALVAVESPIFTTTVQSFELTDRDWRRGPSLVVPMSDGIYGALDGDTAVFIAFTAPAVALVYTWTNAAWTQTATLDNEQGCSSVAISGSQIALFCRNLLRMFQRIDSTWHEIPAPTRADETADIVRVVLSGERVGISSQVRDDGRVVSEVFRWSDGLWRSELHVRSDRSATNCTFACNFGIAALAGDRVVLYRDATSLAAYRFVSGAWAEQPPFVLPPSQRSPDAEVVQAALTDDELIASVPSDSNGIDPHAGAIYVFPWK